MRKLRVGRASKWILVALGSVVTICLIWLAAFSFGFVYASWKMEWIRAQNLGMRLEGRELTQGAIESNKGLLFSRKVDLSFLGGYQSLPQLDGIVDETTFVYSLFGAYFTVVYDNAGKVVVIVDNGLDG
jgi:hypothetical protein